MNKPITSRRKAGNYFVGLFLIGLSIVSLTNTWWPGILLAIGLPLAFRQYLRGRVYDMTVTLTIFLGLFTLYLFDWERFLVAPVLLLIAGIFILFREYTQRAQRAGIEEVENVQEEFRDSEDSK